MSDRIRLALVGCGAVSGWRRRDLAQARGIEMPACIDADPPRARRWEPVRADAVA